MHRSFPGLSRAKPILLFAALLLAGCAGTRGGGTSWQAIDGNGFRFEAPAGWTVGRVGGALSASKGHVDLVQVRMFRLVRRYRSELFAAASRELDSRVAELARLQHGRVTTRATVRVSALDARGYRIAYGSLVEEITFVLDARREYELVCRRTATASNAACLRLVAKFRLR